MSEQETLQEIPVKENHAGVWAQKGCTLHIKPLKHPLSHKTYKAGPSAWPFTGL